MVDKKFIFDDELKSASSYRTLPLLPNIADKLKKHQKTIEQNKAFFGNTYNYEHDGYVFVDEKGLLFQPTHITHGFNKFLKNNNLRHIRFHDLRHSCASLLLANGIGMKQIQEWLGHADFATTADRYVHLDFNSKIQSAKAITNAFAKEEKQSAELSLKELDEINKQLLNNMKELGIKSVDEYLEFLNNAKNIIKTAESSKENETDIVM